MNNRKSPCRFILSLFVLISLVFATYPLQVMADSTGRATEEEAFFQESYLQLSKKEYKELDQSFQKYLDLYAESKVSAEDLAGKFEVFSKMSSLEPRFNEWVALFPNSYTARLARGIYRVTDAWEKRGSQFSSRTADERLNRFAEILNDAHSDLMASLKLYARPVDSYRYLIRVAKGLSLGTERNLLDAAIEIDPKAYQARFEYFDAITPKWGGDVATMDDFLEECKKSQMSDEDKKHIEGKYYYSLGQQAAFDKDYKTASSYYYKYYQTNNNPKNLQLSGQTAFDGGFKDLALDRFNELVKTHPDYPYGYEVRGFVYENHVKDIAKANEDYLTAANLGAHWSQNRMGWNYMMGITVPVDYVKARYFLELSAKQGNRNAIANLATLEKLQASPK